MADAHDAGSRRSIEHQYDRAKHRRGHCTPGLRRKPLLQPASHNFFNLNAFALPPANAGRFGSCGVGILQGPGMIDVDAGLAKVFKIGGAVPAALRSYVHQCLESHQFCAARTEHRKPLELRGFANRAAPRLWRQSYRTASVAGGLLKTVGGWPQMPMSTLHRLSRE